MKNKNKIINKKTNRFYNKKEIETNNIKNKKQPVFVIVYIIKMKKIAERIKIKKKLYKKKI